MGSIVIRTLVSFGLGLAAFGPIQSQAQEYPQKPVTVIVGYAPGGGVDRMVRLVAQKLSQRLGQQFVVENRPGASGTVGLGAVARAEPDGYTIYGGGNPEFSLVPQLQQVSYRPFEDLALLGLAAFVPTVIVTNPDYPAKDLMSLVLMAKMANGVPYGTPGEGTPMHLAIELFNARQGTRFIHVPYKGGGPATADAIAGHIPMAVINAPPLLPHIAAGKLRAIAVIQPERSALLPDVPTVKEVTGFSEGYAAASFLFAAPAKTPDSIRQKLDRELRAVLQIEETKEQFRPLGMEIAAMPGEKAAAWLQSEAAGFSTTIREAGLKLK